MVKYTNNVKLKHANLEDYYYHSNDNIIIDDFNYNMNIIDIAIGEIMKNGIEDNSVSLDKYATKEFVEMKISEIEPLDADGFASEDFVEMKISEINIPSTYGLASEDYVSVEIEKNVDGLASEVFVEDKVEKDILGLASEVFVHSEIEKGIDGLASEVFVHSEIEKGIDGLASEVFVQDCLKTLEISSKKYITCIIGSSTMGHTEENVDFLCTGENDNIIINKAITSMINGGELKILEGNYNISSSILVNQNNIDIIMTSRTHLISSMIENTATITNTYTRNPIINVTGANITITGGNIENNNNSNIAIACKSTGIIDLIDNVIIDGCACGILVTSSATIKKIQNIDIDVYGLGTSVGVYNYSTIIQSIHNCNITVTGHHAVYGYYMHDNAIHGDIINCNFILTNTNTATSNIYKTSSIYCSNKNTINYIDTCYFYQSSENNDSRSIEIFYSTINNILNSTFEIFNIQGSSIIMYLNNSTCRNIDNCKIISSSNQAQGHGIYLYSNSYIESIINCYIYSQKSATYASCVHASNSSDIKNITGCNFYIDSTSTISPYGISITNSSSIESINNNIFSINSILGATGIILNPNIELKTIINNNLISINSSSILSTTHIMGINLPSDNINCIINGNIINLLSETNKTSVNIVSNNSNLIISDNLINSPIVNSSTSSNGNIINNLTVL